MRSTDSAGMTLRISRQSPWKISMWFLRSWKAGEMGTREFDLEEPGDFEPGDNFAPGDLLIALEGEDIDQVGSLIEWLEVSSEVAEKGQKAKTRSKAFNAETQRAQRKTEKDKVKKTRQEEAGPSELGMTAFFFARFYLEQVTDGSLKAAATRPYLERCWSSALPSVSVRVFLRISAVINSCRTW